MPFRTILLSITHHWICHSTKDKLWKQNLSHHFLPPLPPPLYRKTELEPLNFERWQPILFAVKILKCCMLILEQSITRGIYTNCHTSTQNSKKSIPHANVMKIRNLKSLVTNTFVWQLLLKLKAHFSVESSAIKPMSRKHSMPSGCWDHLSCKEK